MRNWTRRRVLLSAVATASILGVRVARPQSIMWSSGTEKPTTSMPPKACDCHMHVYSHKYRTSASFGPAPADALMTDYRQLQTRLGLSRTVISQSHAYGTDNRGMLNALQTLGPSARGIAVTNVNVAARELKQLDRLGVRGLRLTLASQADMEMIETLADRIAPLGWHVELGTNGAALVAFGKRLSSLRTPVVLEHLGYVRPQAEGMSPELRRLLEMLETGNIWICLSGPYLFSKVGPPYYPDAGIMVATCARAAPNRLLWGTDWPHPEVSVKPDDALLLDLLAAWVPDEAARNRILVSNPATLYGFVD
jgi:D-galactarolactone isomerase